jgi:hypothetical protein
MIIAGGPDVLYKANIAKDAFVAILPHVADIDSLHPSSIPFTFHESLK